MLNYILIILFLIFFIFNSYENFNINNYYHIGVIKNMNNNKKIFKIFSNSIHKYIKIKNKYYKLKNIEIFDGDIIIYKNEKYIVELINNFNPLFRNLTYNFKKISSYYPKEIKNLNNIFLKKPNELLKKNIKFFRKKSLIRNNTQQHNDNNLYNDNNKYCNYFYLKDKDKVNCFNLNNKYKNLKEIIN